VQVASTLNLINALATTDRPAPKLQAADTSLQTFTDSLLAVSHDSSHSASSLKGDEESGQLPASLPERLKETGIGSLAKGSLPPALNCLMTSRPVLATQRKPVQIPLADPASVQLPVPVAKLAASLPSPNALAVQLKRHITRPADTHSNTDQLSQPFNVLQAALILPNPENPMVTSSLVTADSNLYSIANANASPTSSLTPGFAFRAIQDTPQTPAANLVANLASKEIANVVPREIQKVVRTVVQSFNPSTTANEVPGSLPRGARVASQTSLLSAVQSSAPNSLPSQAEAGTPSAAAETVQTSIPVFASTGPQIAAPTAVPAIAHSAVLSATPQTAIPGSAFSAQDAVPVTTSAVATTILPQVPPAAVKTIQPAVASSPRHPEPNPDAQGARNTSSKTDVAPATPSATDPGNPPAVSPDPIGFVTGLNVPNATANQMTALVEPKGGALAIGDTGFSSNVLAKPGAAAGAKRNDVAINTSSDVQVNKQHTIAAPDQPESQDTTSSDDQPQGGAAQPGQGAAPAQMSFANHTVASTDHVAGTNITPQPAATLPVIAHPAKTQESPAPIPAALPQPLPAINTAKLIQSMGQSEMRVNMRTTEFGNISINTSTTRDLISAQISLEHGELARTLATHLPEMQARLGGNQTVDVRIEMNGQATGQTVGTSAGMSENTADQSGGGRQQSGSTGSGNLADGFVDQVPAAFTAAMPPAESRLDTRLDIRA